MFRRLGILTLTLLGAGCGGSGGSGGADLNCDGNPVDGAAPRAWYPDPDNDGFASVSSDVVLACADPGGGRTTVLGDCAPLDPLVSPAAVEVYDNDFDDDCNPLTLDDDHDADGVSGVDDCDDADPQVGSPGTSFVDVAASAGIAGAILAFGPDAANCADNVFVAGTAVGDIDGDGRWDVYVAGLDSPGYLYRNMGDGTFTDVTAGSGLVPMVGGSAAVFADLDADGDSDLYVTTISTGASRLYINDGAGHFVDEAVARGASAPVTGPCGLHTSVTAADVDGDGDIDLHLPSWATMALVVAPDARVLLNDGTGHFSRAPTVMGLNLSLRSSFTPGYADFDGDGRRDLAFAGDFSTSGLRRAVGDPPLRTFIDVTALVGVGLDENGMGADIADYDGDGDLDWFVTAIFPTSQGCYSGSPGCHGNRLYRNRGDGHFDEVAVASGVADGGWGWGTAFFDFDHDGDLDLGNTNGFLTYGHDSDRIRMFVADGAGGFSEQACALGVTATGVGRAFVPFDFDGDGDLDILTTEHAAAPHLYRNDVGSATPWLRVRLYDPMRKNTAGLGATVWLRRSVGGAWVRREINANSTYAGVRPPEAHFGLGSGEAPVADLRIVWPDGGEQILTNVAVRQALRIVRAP